MTSNLFVQLKIGLSLSTAAASVAPVATVAAAATVTLQRRRRRRAAASVGPQKRVGSARECMGGLAPMQRPQAAFTDGSTAARQWVTRAPAIRPAALTGHRRGYPGRQFRRSPLRASRGRAGRQHAGSRPGIHRRAPPPLAGRRHSFLPGGPGVSPGVPRRAGRR